MSDVHMASVEPGGMRGIHLDLKYQMPNKRYLLDWLTRLPGWGINTVLLEYEDKFPYTRHPFLRAPDAFTPEELTRFLRTARNAGLRVIPLMQSLSHLEFALAHEELAALREAPDVPTMICPGKPEAVEFVKTLCREVLAFHKEDEFFHLGGDETWFLGTCASCAARKAERGATGMWIDHERPLAEFIVAEGKRPIFWDDVLKQNRDLLRNSPLPRETVLHAWNYNIMDFGGRAKAETDSEFGGDSGALRQIEDYRAAGYDSIGGPCLNYGQIFPRLTPSIRNTAAWAHRMRASRMLGLINTSWASFHVPLQMQNMLVAATGALCHNPDAVLDAAWQQAWLENEYGTAAAGVPEALETFGQLWEIPVKGYDRPFSPLVYGYMNMVFHYPGGQSERRRRGAYPADWSEIDFTNVYRKGLEAVRTTADRDAVRARLDEILAAYPPAVSTLTRFAERASRRRDEAEMMAFFAQFKLLSARVFDHLLEGRGSVAALRDAWSAGRETLTRMLSMAFESEGQHRMLRAWWEPADRMLA